MLIDIIYGIGNKFVIFIIYEYVELLNCDIGKRVNLFGFIMFYVCERKEDFVYFV